MYSVCQCKHPGEPEQRAGTSHGCSDSGPLSRSLKSLLIIIDVLYISIRQDIVRYPKAFEHVVQKKKASKEAAALLSPRKDFEGSLFARVHS